MVDEAMGRDADPGSGAAADRRTDPEAGGAGAEGSAADWRVGLPDDLRKAAERFNSPADAVKVAVDLRKKLSNAIARPGADADAAEIAAFRRHLGVPDTPDGYDIADPAGLPEILRPDAAALLRQDSFLAALHAAGATPEVARAATSWYYDNLNTIHAAGQKAFDEANETADAELRRDWGADFDKQIGLAQRAYRSLVPDALKEKLEAISLDADADVKRLFNMLGRQIVEDDLIAAGQADGAQRTLEERARDLRARDDYWTNDAVQHEMRDIMERLHGTRPIHPSDG